MLRSRLGIATVLCFVLGAGLLFPFEGTLTRIGGLAFLFAFIVCGAFLIANPDDLAAEAMTDVQEDSASDR
jgi:hypothetical protein